MRIFKKLNKCQCVKSFLINVKIMESDSDGKLDWIGYRLIILTN